MLGSDALKRLVIGDSSLQAVTDGLRALLEVDTGVARRILGEIVAGALLSIIGGPNSLSTLTDFLEVAQKVDVDLVRQATFHIEPSHLANAIKRTGAFSLGGRLARLASLNGEVIRTMSDVIVDVCVPAKPDRDLTIYYAGEVLESVGDVDPELLAPLGSN